MITPISPSEIEEKSLNIPDFVIEIANQLIIENYSNGYSKIYFDDFSNKIKAVCPNKGLIYKSNWLDIESTYRKHGWKVVVYKPDYTESYRGYFEFKKIK